MASVSEEILFEVRFTDDNTAQRMAEIQNSLADLKDEYDGIKKAIKENGAVTAEQAKRMAENKAEVQALTNEHKFYEKQLKAEAKQNELVNDSINAMRTNLGKMVSQYDALSKAERENVNIGGKLLDAINEQTDAIKEAEYATQRYQRNVGNYENAIKNALPPQLQFVNGLAETANEAGGAVPMMKNFGTAIGNVAKQAMAFIATPIGAAIAAIAAAIALVVAGAKQLQKAFQRTETNGDKLASSMGKLKGLMNAFHKAIEPIAKWFADTFSKVIDAVVGSLGRLVTSLQKMLEWVGKVTGSDMIQGWAKGLNNIIVKTGEMVDVTSRLSEEERKLNRERRESEKIQLKYQYEAEKWRQIRDDESKTLAERVKANEQVNKALQQQLKEEMAIANKEVEVAKMRIHAEGQTEDAMDALNEAEIRVMEIRERINGQTSEYLANVNALRKEAQATAQVADEVVKKVSEWDSMSTEDMTKKLLGAPKMADVEEEDDEEIEDVTKIYTERNNLRLQYEKMGFDERLKLQKENLDLERAQRIASGEDAINTEMWYQGELTRITAENAEARKQKMMDAVSVSLQSASAFVGALREMAKASGEEAKYEKLLAGAEIAINTATAISQAVSSAMSVGFPACIPAVITAIGAVVAGMVQATTSLKSANVPSVPKFAQGGLVTGEGTATSDSIPAMLSNGESVMTARATSAYSGILSALNTSVGGAPIGESTKTKGTQQLVQQFADAVANTPIYTAVTDINEGQARVAKIVDNSNY